MAGLNSQQRLFAAEYAIDHNATAAAIRAGYSPKSAPTTGHRLLKNPQIRSLIDKADTRAVEAAEIKAADVLARAWQIAQQNKPDRVAALNLIAKSLPEFRANAGDSQAGSQHLHLHGVSDAALLRLAERLGPPSAALPPAQP